MKQHSDRVLIHVGFFVFITGDCGDPTGTFHVGKAHEKNAVFHRVRKGQLRERWSWFTGLGMVQFLVGAIACGCLFYGPVSLFSGNGLLQEWLNPCLWLINLFIGIHMIFRGLSLFSLGLAAKNLTADNYGALTDVLISSERTSSG